MDVTLAQPQALATSPASPVAVVETPPPEGFVQRVMALSPQRKMMLGGGLAALVALTVMMGVYSHQPDYKVLYTNLSDKDGGAILAQLQQMNVPYKHADGGAAILVPADKVHDVRLKLATAGYPKGSVVGFELMETQKFGVTQFQERLNFQRGLEGELTRSIQALSGVESARVHLALPNQNGFFREQQKPSASVVLTLHPGRVLDKGQIAGIVHLVSSSVPEMSPKAVSVVDQSGTLLAGMAEGMQDNSNNGLDAQQLLYVRQMENKLTDRVRELLEPVVGKDNLRAQVTADIDFSQIESTAEEYKPNQNTNTAAVRSQQSSEQVGAGGSANATGVPGAMSNQPPTPATAPVNGASAPLQGAPGANGTGGTMRRDNVTNYEVDRTVRVTRNSTGNVRRLTAAVVVNHVTKTDAKGKTTTEPPSQEELDKLTALVKETVGFNEQRGDSVKVVAAPFQPVKDDVVEVPFYKQPEMIDLLKTLALPLAFMGLAGIVVFGAIKPALQAAKPLPPAEPEKAAAGLNAVVDDANELPELTALGPDGQPLEGAASEAALVDGQHLPALEGPDTDPRLASARKLAKENPVAMATLMRGWINNDA